MTTIPHRELRNNSSKILERVKNGEIINVTNSGEVAATLIPPPSSVLEQLIHAGRVRQAISDGPIDFTAIPRVALDASTEEIRQNLRGDR